MDRATAEHTRHYSSQQNTHRESAPGQKPNMVYYDENVFIDQAIHQSLQDKQTVNDDEAEFNRALQQVLKDSQFDYDIQVRKQKEEETMMLS